MIENPELERVYWSLSEWTLIGEIIREVTVTGLYLDKQMCYVHPFPYRESSAAYSLNKSNLFLTELAAQNELYDRLMNKARQVQERINYLKNHES